MNYRHAFHAGNFADVVKHVVLTRVLLHLARKAAPFRVIDSHAGRGLYDLAGADAARTGEWRDGIGRLMEPGAGPIPSVAAELLEPYLSIVRAVNPGVTLDAYPGSPVIAAALLRPDDRLVLNELQPDERSELGRRFARDHRVAVTAVDGYAAVRATLPPKERRGVVLIDPPFEEPGELERLIQALKEGVKRFSTGTYILWHPIKDVRSVERFHAALAATGLPKLLAVELRIRRAVRDGRVLSGCGIIVHNPPFTLADELGAVLPFLATRFAKATGASSSIVMLSA
jgi:23S rRNA (adenine2030-N6)-methyltransferase